MIKEQFPGIDLCFIFTSTGHDIESIRRVEEMLQGPPELFLTKVFTSEEIARYGKRPESLAARWAGKEAVSKAIGIGIPQGRHKCIEILDDKKKPIVILHDFYAEKAKELGFQRFDISLSHEHREFRLASAFVTAIGICPYVKTCPEAEEILTNFFKLDINYTTKKERR